jgi:hypothetical protein
MSFFYDINKRLNSLLNEGRGSKPDFLDLDKDGDKTEPMKQAAREVDEGSTGDYSATKARAGKDIGKPGKQFGKIAADAAKRYGSKERGEKVAGAVLAKLRAKESIDEADMEEGNEFSGALAKAKAAGAKSFEVDGREYPVKEGKTEYDPVTGVTRHRGSYGTEYQGDDGDDDDFDQFGNRKPGAKKKAAVDPTAPKRGRGRPKGTGRAIGAKGPTGTSKLMREEDMEEAIGDPEGRGEREAQRRQLATDHKKLNDLERRALEKAKQTKLPAKKTMGEDYDKDEYDEEGEMAKSFLRTIEDAAEELQSILSDDENLPEWVQKKITLAKEYVDTARDYLAANRPEDTMDESALQAYLGNKKYGKQGMKALQKAGREGASKAKMDQIRSQHDKLDEVELDEKAVSKAQRAAAGIAYAAKKGDLPKSELRGASKEMAKMATGELKKFAKTREKGLPEKKKEVDETTVAGSMSVSDAAPKGKSGGMQFGKGIYDSWNRELESMIAESMTVNLTVSSEHGKNLTVTATDEDADKLAAMLNLAGMGRMHSTCPRCGQSPCACDSEIVDENQPDWPTNTETSHDALQYSGGLNKPKRDVAGDGQSTIPVTAISSVNEDELARMRAMAGVKS